MRIMKIYDYLVVGYGLYGSVFSHEVNANGKSVFVVDKRSELYFTCNGVWYRTWKLLFSTGSMHRLFQFVLGGESDQAGEITT